MKKNSPSRRNFLAASAAGAVAVPAIAKASTSPLNNQDGKIVVISSGNGHSRGTTQTAYDMIANGSDVLDAVIAGVNLVEEDPSDTSVGYGGLPNERGVVQLDSACMHGPTHRAGGVACIENIKYPSKVARLVAQRTDHVLIVGRGALEFAKAHGFPEENLLTDLARKAWLRWKENLSDTDDWLAPEPENNDDGKDDETDEAFIARVLRNRPTGTIHCSGLDPQGNMSCVTTTSGLAFKIPGRVGDSPIIGAGLYVDNEVGSCGSTGRGEANLESQCCSLAVELMRTGMTPEEAGLEVLRRVSKHTIPRLQNDRGEPAFGLNFYLIRKDGLYAGVTMRGRSRFAVADENGARREECKALY